MENLLVDLANWISQKLGFQAKPVPAMSARSKNGEVVKGFEEKAGVFEGKVRVSGEIFTATADGPLEVGAKVTVIDQDGLRLGVRGF
jgi:membrane-bound ClpP family serine protease